VNELVLDASVLVKWFKSAGEQHLAPARDLYDHFSRGELVVLVPPLVFLELLNAAARRWGWETYQLETFAGDLELLGLEVRQPALVRVAHWCARGLTAYDAAYVALAEERRTVVVTEDEQIITVAGDLARTLGKV